MIKKITLLVALAAFTTTSFAQISFDNNDFEQPNLSKDEFDYNATAYLTNNSSDPSDTLYAWELKKVKMPLGWETTVCSGDLCIPEPKVAYNFVLNTDSTELFKLGYAFFGEAGSGEAYVVAYSLKDPSKRDSMRLSITARDLVSTKDVAKSDLRVYPNPAKDNVFVEYTAANYTVNIYDILGNLKVSQNINKGDAVNISDLVRGVYVVRIDGDLSFSKVLQKQ